MILVQNLTDSVVVVKNRHCRYEIPIGQDAALPVEALGDDLMLTITYFSRNTERKETVVDIEKGFRGRHLVIRQDSEIPVGTRCDVKDGAFLILDREDVTPFFLLTFWKQFLIRRIAVRTHPNNGDASFQGTHFFLDDRHRKKVLSYLGINAFLTALLALACLVTLVGALIFEETSEMLFPGLVGLLVFGGLAAYHFVHLFRMRRWTR